ncbi:MAG: four helix bundle protein [Candidatus Omnitrophica bacterium]|nr:four helix bundle protein [Candidatus Omnitrophota bacterium]
MKHYKDLKIWQKGMDIVNAIYEITKKYPEDEKFGMISQMRRASVSVPSNIAEGFRRNHAKEFKQFLAVARGSIAELETQVFISANQGYITDDKQKALLEELDILSRMIFTFSQKLK